MSDTKKEIVIDITPQGEAEAMHFDEFPLSFLGKMKVQRASEITFNSATQLWDIHYYHEKKAGVVVYAHTGFEGYDEARKHEVDFVQRCRKAGVKFDENFVESISLAFFNSLGVSLDY